MRFSGSDSTTTLVALSEEIIDLVNVKHALKDKVLQKLGWILDEILNFYQHFWKNISTILNKGEVKDEILENYSWEFHSTSLKDNTYFLEKMSQNFVKFFAKFYDIYRTDLHKEFDKINAHRKIIEIFVK